MFYDVVEAFTVQDLLAQVRQYLENGWELRGDFVVVVDSKDTMHFFQAMVKTER